MLPYVLLAVAVIIILYLFTRNNDRCMEPMTANGQDGDLNDSHPEFQDQIDGSLEKEVIKKPSDYEMYPGGQAVFVDRPEPAVSPFDRPVVSNKFVQKEIESMVVDSNKPMKELPAQRESLKMNTQDLLFENPPPAPTA